MTDQFANLTREFYYYLAGIDAIIALLREPDDDFIENIACATQLQEDDIRDVVMHAIADELERRKP